LLRDMDLQSQTDGKKYTYNDMVRVGCNDCEGCFECCRTVDDTILLDPYDIYRMVKGTGMSVEMLFAKHIELGMAGGVILPHMKVDEEKGCTFLNEKGRCSIHAYRSGFCRLYPLGRLYENGDYSYILMTDQCDKGKTKVKISKWLNTPEYSKYHAFILCWHDFIRNFQDKYTAGGETSDMKAVLMRILQVFYLTNYDTEADFYQQFYDRMDGYKV